MLTTTTLEGYAFRENTNITSIDIPSGVKSIGMYCLMKCSGITSVDIPDSVTYIAEGAFQYNPSLTSVTIGNGITTILWSAFRGCSGLTSITVNAVTPPTLGGDALSMTNDCPIYVPCDSVDAYKAASGWSDYASRIQAIEGSCPSDLQPSSM
jgi:hypothetical protein